MLRDIFTVTEQIMEYIPKNDSSATLFLHSIEKFMRSLVFIPPEQMFDMVHYKLLALILIEHFGETPPTEEWKKDVYDVWMDRKRLDNTHK